jgi:hypothetical protein
MKVQIVLRLAGSMVAGCVLACAGPTAVSAATAGTGAYVGSGTTSPGLSVVPTAQNVAGSGTLAGLAVVGGPVVINDTCSFSGSTDIASTLAQSDGNLTVSCSGTAATTAALHYTRTAAVVTLQGTGTINGAAVLVHGACAFLPTSAPTVTTYVLICGLVATDIV